MRNSFIFYDSFADTIASAPEESQLELYRYIVECGLDRITIADVPYPASLFVRQAMASVNIAHDRYDKAKTDGEKGGRPRKWVDREEAEKLYAELGSWDKVCDALNVHPDTLRAARREWNKQSPKNPEKPKNLNVNVNGSVNGIVNANAINDDINNKKDITPSGSAPPKAAQPSAELEMKRNEDGSVTFIKHEHGGTTI